MKSTSCEKNKVKRWLWEDKVYRWLGVSGIPGSYILLPLFLLYCLLHFSVLRASFPPLLLLFNMGLGPCWVGWLWRTHGKELSNNIVETRQAFVSVFLGHIVSSCSTETWALAEAMFYHFSCFPPPFSSSCCIFWDQEM